LGDNERLLRRVQARSTALALELSQRRTAAARAAAPDDPRAGQRAARRTRDQLREQMGWSPSQTTSTLRRGAHLASLPRLAAAFTAGEVTQTQVEVIVRTCAHLVGEVRARVEAQLVAAAGRGDAVALGREARRLLASIDHDAAMADLDRQYAQRAASIGEDPWGMKRLSARLAGLDGEVLQTAINAFRTPDPPDTTTPRTAEQATADALVAMARAALDHGRAPTSRGQRPHINVNVAWTDLVAGSGAGYTPWSGPLPIGEIRRLLDDASISRIITGPDSLPIDTGRATRNVTIGVWRALVARDQGCTVAGCGAPPAWCDGAHIDQRWIEGAGVSTHEVALLCRYHHRIADRQHWTATITNGTVTWTRPHPHTPHGPDP
jgi:hypothetical protein